VGGGRVFEPTPIESVSTGKGSVGKGKPQTPVEKLIAEQLALEGKTNQVQIQKPSQKPLLSGDTAKGIGASSNVAQIDAALASIKANLEKPFTKVKTVINKDTLAVGKQLSSSVQPAAVSSAFAGKGTYETTAGGLLPGDRLKPVDDFSYKGLVDTGMSTRTDQATDTGLKTGIGGRNKIIDITLTGQTNIEDTAQLQDNALVQQNKQALKQVLREISLNKLKTKPQKFKPVNTFVPKFISGESSLDTKKSKGLLEAYEVFAKIKKKTTKIGEEFSLSKAVATLSSNLKGGLQASGFLVEKRTGRKISFAEVSNLLGKDFRAGVKDPFKIVQGAGTRRERGIGNRLGSRSERLEIRRSKKSSGGKRGKLKWFS
jgi:hypothetical protein